jgi:hypothetical protein
MTTNSVFINFIRCYKEFIMVGNTKYFNKWLYVQKYYDIYNEVYFWRFWVIGFYFDTDKNSL